VLEVTNLDAESEESNSRDNGGDRRIDKVLHTVPGEQRVAVAAWGNLLIGPKRIKVAKAP
jgi:hypothetical protein